MLSKGIPLQYGSMRKDGWNGHEYRQVNNYNKTKREEHTYLRTHIIMTEATQHWILRNEMW